LQDLLIQNNIALYHDIEQLQYSILESEGNTHEELHAYIVQIKKECDNLHRRVLQNLKDLELEQENLLKDILSETELVTRNFYALNGVRLSPILRARASDKLSLKFLKWLHETDPQAKNIPAAVCDGEFSIFPIQPTIYGTPCTSQQGLRNLPIFFHEFGHLLYRLHQQEMDVLVHELQEEIKQLLRPPVERNDEYEQEQESERDVVVDTWYEWAQECFCDAIGFVMGGPSFTYAFSMYFRVLGWSEYYVPKGELAHRSHPVTWMRIQLLANRVRRIGYDIVANDLEEKWEQIAGVLGVTEDYDGYYDPKFLPKIQEKIDDMLTETSPREFLESEVSNQGTELTFTSPVVLLNMAWQKFFDDPDSYREWEKEAIISFLNTDS
jgi:hypothetical protein